MIDAGAPPAVPGLVLDRLIGAGEHGEVWRALDLGAVRTVAVHVGRPAGGAGAAAREAALLRRVDHENVVLLHSVLDLPDGRRAVVLDLVPGGDLATLVRRRGPLPTAEVVSVAIGLARALAHVHALGFVHGRLSAHDVLFAADGRPVLTGLGIGALLAPMSPAGPPSYPTPPDDVRALGEVLRFALTGARAGTAVPGQLAPLVASCLAADPDARPSPTRVGTMAWDAAPGVPVLLDPVEPPERSAAVGQPSDTLPMRSVTRALVVGVGVALGVAALVAGAWAVAPRVFGVRPVPVPSPSAASGDGLDDVQGLVAGLAAGRARAMADRDVPALAAVDAPGSAALTADSAFIARLRAAAVTLRGLRFAVTDAGVVEVSGDAATVQARVTTSAYVEVRRDGSVARRVAAGTPRTVRLALLRTPDGWRITRDR
jgi:hypothetical protein